MNDNDDFHTFAAALGKLMVAGLNRQPESTRRMISETVARGGELYAICTPEPVTLSCMLAQNGHSVELFKVTEPMH